MEKDILFKDPPTGLASRCVKDHVHDRCMAMRVFSCACFDYLVHDLPTREGRPANITSEFLNDIFAIKLTPPVSRLMSN